MQRAITIARQAEDRKDESQWLDRMGRVHATLGQNQEAAACFEEALQLARAIGLQGLTGSALGNLANLYLDAGDLDRAVRVLKKCSKSHGKRRIGTPRRRR
ncbi:MAG: tetratricopeptide repeat protein [Anaerolineae bacterium]|nr:MAG: tetratricopeptide repeat protein [Anaerolineae bacterium]